MKINVIDYRSEIRPKRNEFYLENRHWDDFGFETLYILYLFTDENKLEKIGEVKILKQGASTLGLDKEFEELDETYCSLGQSRGYYKNLKKYLDNEKMEIFLSAIKDCCFNNDIYNSFKGELGFQKSLIRESLVERLIRGGIGNKIIKGYVENLQNSLYTYTHKIERAAFPHELEFDFKENHLPYRINAIIGKNGVGKSEILKNMVIDLVKNENKFKPYPQYEKIFFLSYGVYDKLEELDTLQQNNSGKFEFIKEIFVESNFRITLKRIEDEERLDYLNILLKNLLGNSGSINKYIDESYKNLDGFSSGQKMMIEFAMSLTSKIEPESLIVIDEPENHLHPNLIGTLFNCLTKILDDYNSHLIISTHSPIILQQIPSKNVILIKRDEDDIPSVTKLGIECFGEDIGEITNYIFSVSEIESNYKGVFRKLIEEKFTYEEILDLFQGKLSYNSKLYLKQYVSKS